MNPITSKNRTDLKVSKMAENLIGSEIIKLAGEIREKMARGEKVYNFTIGDFDPSIFPIPQELKLEIIDALHKEHTNYPPSEGMLELRQSVSYFLKKSFGLQYTADEILIAGGARPIIYSIFQAIVDPGETVVFPVPSWNNNHYAHLSHSKQVFLETKPENNFMPTAQELAPFLKEASILALCSPLNPTGTIFSKENLEEICSLIIDENETRKLTNKKPLYLMYDQIYCLLIFNGLKHYDPVSLNPAMKNYTIYVDGISKAFAATGVRVGWTFGPKRVIDKMKSILGHIGAWSPKAEQVGTGKFLKNDLAVNGYMKQFNNEISERLNLFHQGFLKLKMEGFPVDTIEPQAAIYLTIKIDLSNLITTEGTHLVTTKDATNYLLDQAKLAIVPFSAFGSSADSKWYRLSVGTSKKEEIQNVFIDLKIALQKLNQVK
jgi:aspartate aminotransferase